MNSFQPAVSAQLITSGDPFFKTLERIIDEATETIHLQTYIFEADATGMAVIDALKRAVARGVSVYALADAYGSKSLSNHFVKEVNAAGIHFRLFSPFFSSESIYMGRRLHHKIVVVDKRTVLIGGINIADKYHGTPQERAWLDYAVLLKGGVCEPMHVLCEFIYQKKNTGRLPFAKSKINQTKAPLLARFTINDWIRRRNEIYRSYIRMLNSSKESVVFIASYFLPGYRFRRALKKARQRGVRVTVILAGKSDMPLLFYAEKYLYPFFLKYDMEIYEWKQSTMHAKALIADDAHCTIGSFNLNPLSRYRSIELNAELISKEFTQEFRTEVKRLLTEDCTRVEAAGNVYADSRWARMRNYMIYYFFRIFFMLFTSKKTR